ncbi:hypothetical protein N0V93_003361 [Gnomoniopsis smithogilvyi]|uniref:DUF1765-domain-containing protein n=1 Tax=Gnomoniopsis smithogilvyi TaxID=1191159 RepID=A0A9W8YWI8_9PEZI|nr:hypothetical protein N0V93_003361 [Gnomoniopsis smithogilvyi]
MAAPAVHRSHSSPDLFLDSTPLTKSSPSLNSPIDLHGAAAGASPSSAQSSGTTNDFPSFNFGFDLPTNTLELTLPKVEVTNEDPPKPPMPQLPLEPMAVPQRPLSKSRSKSLVGRPKSWLPSRSATTDAGQKEKSAVLRKEKKAETDKNELAVLKGEATPERPEYNTRYRSRSFKSSSFADYAKKSWGSRSPSPKRDIETERQEALRGLEGGQKTDVSKKEPSMLSPRKLTRRKNTADSVGDKEKVVAVESPPNGKSGTSRALNRASTYLGKMKQPKQTTTQATVKAGATLTVPSPAPLPKSETLSPVASTKPAPEKVDHRLSSQTITSSHSDTNTGGTDSTGVTEPSQCSETLASPKSQPQRDPIWGTFRRMDSEYAIFLTKTTTSQRILIARNTLIPFFRNHGAQTSADDNALSFENVDRRTTILHKWWNGLLELLEGTGPKKDNGLPATTFASIQAKDSPHGLQPVSGVDRPGLLELITNIMMRPEWRMCTPAFQPLKQRSLQDVNRGRTKARESTDFIAESAEHNVRTMFVNNLLAQMGIVVEKMSSRHAPASLVTFCGKACAYAFFFVPGIAEVLVRLWGLTPDLLRRVADDFGLPRRSKGDSEDIVSMFPPTLSRLGWSSVKMMTDNLRLTTKLSLIAAKIHWHGPWVSRWRGADSDLFFIFTKYYYILMEDFIPADLALASKVKAPGFALIHAQLLSVLDSTIHHRQAALENMMGPQILDATNGVDAMAAALAQLPPNNLLRGMDENRLIVLLKDMLAKGSVGGLTATARDTFATSFMLIMKAATRKTPAFKQAPTLVLIDFFSEVLLVLDTYTGYTNPERKSRPVTDHVDWKFWLDVFHKVLFESNSTMSEIRILSLLYAAWDILTSDTARKEKLCIDWLLSEPVFDKFFNNYTPMVRAYFMRLLCWRVCRDQGNPQELDMRIFSLVSERLKQTWSHYLWMKQAADAAGKLPPSTAPCHPQPGKRFMIIRTEQPAPQTGLLQTGFDSINSTFGSYETSTVSPASTEKRDNDTTTSQTEPATKKRWSMFGKLMNFSSSTAAGSSGPDGTKRNNTTKDDLAEARRATAAERSGPSPPSKASHSSTESDASSTGSVPVYEATQFVFKFTLGSLPWNPNADMTDAASTMLSTLPRERPLCRPRLPAPAQARVSARNASTGSGAGQLSSPSADMPLAERIYSGTSERGLVSGARNAAALEEAETDSDQETPTGKEPQSPESAFKLPQITRVASVEWKPDASLTTSLSSDSTTRLEVLPGRGREADRQVVLPVQPVGAFRARATYSGRALAEWGIVVHECNSFIDRRRDEGVSGLRDVEVPSLGVENLRRMG